MIGIHIKSKKLHDIKLSFKYAKFIGCTHIQMFNENIEDCKYIKTLLKKLDLHLIIHSPYIINIASQFDEHNWRTKYLLLEIENSINNGADGLVVHMGKSMNLPIPVAYDNMYKLLLHICKKIKKPFDIYLETTAGQGTELCYKMDDLGIFYNRIKENPKMKRIKICLDTCHLFCAGYDLRKKHNIEKFIEILNKNVGIENIGIIHLNDSVNDLDTRKDRHANIGEGYIGANGLRYFYQYFSNRKIPCILETPIGDYSHEIKLLTTKK